MTLVRVGWERADMAVLRLARFTIDPADTEETRARRVSLVTAIRKTFSGLTPHLHRAK
jgi:hypothetical protein